MSEFATRPLIGPLQQFVDESILGSTRDSCRLEKLKAAAEFVKARRSEAQSAHLMFVCTHNSRRSHFGHVWATTAAHFYGCDDVVASSAGIEVTACNIRTVRALRRAGFSVVEAKSDDASNRTYLVQFADKVVPIGCYSKTHSDVAAQQFVAMMCCAEVDEECPHIEGAIARIPLHYDDPKIADDTPEEDARYDERCVQIGRDMFQLMRRVREDTL